MTRYSFFILCLFLGLLSSVAAVPETVTGTIVDGDSRQHLSGVVVQALDSNGKATAFASSDVKVFSKSESQPLPIPFHSAVWDMNH